MSLFLIEFDSGEEIRCIEDNFNSFGNGEYLFKSTNLYGNNQFDRPLGNTCTIFIWNTENELYDECGYFKIEAINISPNKLHLNLIRLSAKINKKEKIDESKPCVDSF